MLYTPLTETVDHAIIDAVGAMAAADAVSSERQIALAWLRSKPVVTAPLVGASSDRPDRRRGRLPSHRLDRRRKSARWRPYTPRYDFQGISDDTALQAIMARLPQFTTTSVA